MIDLLTNFKMILVHFAIITTQFSIDESATSTPKTFWWLAAFFLFSKVVSEMQKTETKNSKAKDIFEKVKTDVRLMKEELTTIERNQVSIL